MLCGTVLAGPEAVANLQQSVPGKKASFDFGGPNGSEFMLDGKPFQIRSGEMHPQRIPRQYWQHRIRAAKAMGLNTIAFYVFWNGLEQKDGSWNFEGMNDIAAFIDLCQQEGMWVLFRPGPFVCGEWDMGGLPSYLLKDGPTKLRYTGNPEFMKAQTRYLEQMAKIAIPRLSKNGGPILMIQLENEYGSYRTEHDEVKYIEWLRDFWKSKGAERFYLSEGGSPQHLRFVIPNVAVGLDPADSEEYTVHARKVVQNAPVFSSETYPGWLRHWGEGNWAATDKSETMRWYMKSGFSFNIFVLHGGTNFGLTAGANCDAQTGANFQPDLTSYDYGSPIGENGNLVPEYFKYRDIIKDALTDEAHVPAVPATPETMAIAAFTPFKSYSLAQVRTKKDVSSSKYPRTLESVGQNQGIAIYKANLPAGEAGELKLQVRDYAQIYVGSKHIGDIDRRTGQTSITVPERLRDLPLTIVLDTFGHINFNDFIEKDVKGIIGPVTFDGKEILNWRMSRLPLDEGEPKRNKGLVKKYMRSFKGGVYGAMLHLSEVKDTFLDMSKWQKGYVWVNGHLLGRYWNIGPQERLYCPAEFLKVGENRIVVLDTIATRPAPIEGKTERNMEVKTVTESLNNQW